MTTWSLRDVISIATTSLLALAATAIAWVTLRKEYFTPEPSPTARVHAEEQPNWAKYATEGQRIGRADAKAVMVVFSDYQCPACKSLETQLQALRDRFPDDLAVIYRHYPLKSHPPAFTAAVASECASAQGRFEAMHAALFRHTDSIGTVPWPRFGAMAELSDLERFNACMTDSVVKAVVRRGRAAGEEIGIRGTPTVLIDGWRFSGSQPLSTLEAFVRDAMRSRRSRS